MALSNDPIVDLIMSARINMLINQQFYGNLATRLKLVDGSKWCKTAATDGRNLYYNREFIKSLTPKQLIFLLSHEVLHCVFEHIGRRGGRDPKIWNMANDYIVNYTLMNSIVKAKNAEMPAEGLYSEKYTDEMTSEEVYRLLEENSVKIQMTLDEHLTDDGDGDGDGEGNGSGNGITVTVMGDENGPPKITEEDRQKIRNEIKAAVISAAQSVGAGKVPAGIRRLIDAFTSPVMDWRALLEMHIKSSVKDDFTFQRPNNRSWTMGCIFPGQDFMNTSDIAVFIDMSGSISDEMVKDFLTEVKGIMETFDDYKLTLWTFDTQVYNPKVFTPQNMDEIFTYEPKGGGGTMFECNWEFMKDPSSCGFEDEFSEAIEPKRAVCLTDGMPNAGWGDELYCETLFIIHGNTNIEAPFGQTAYYEPKKKN